MQSSEDVVSSSATSNDSSSHRPSPFKKADRTAAHQHEIRRLFEQCLPLPLQPTEFDKVFGEDPLDFLMGEFALPIYQAGTNRADIERHGKTETKVILPPNALNFDEIESALQKQWTERTCTVLAR
jgi:hypothetical protein